MTSLKFSGDVTLDDVFNQNKITIYDNVLKAISEAYRDTSIDEVKVITIEINQVEYSINLARSKFISSLENAIHFYEKLEFYEKCQACLDIITKLKPKK